MDVFDPRRKRRFVLVRDGRSSFSVLEVAIVPPQQLPSSAAAVSCVGGAEGVKHVHFQLVLWREAHDDLDQVPGAVVGGEQPGVGVEPHKHTWLHILNGGQAGARVDGFALRYDFLLLGISQIAKGAQTQVRVQVLHRVDGNRSSRQVLQPILRAVHARFEDTERPDVLPAKLAAKVGVTLGSPDHNHVAWRLVLGRVLPMKIGLGYALLCVLASGRW